VVDYGIPEAAWDRDNFLRGADPTSMRTLLSNILEALCCRVDVVDY